MGEFCSEGVLNTGRNVLHRNLSRTSISKILDFRVNDPNGYTLSVSIFDWGTKTTTLLYEKELDGGDTLTDTIDFIFNQGDEFIVETTSPTTSYYISGIE
jgi:hypothetical protein